MHAVKNFFHNYSGMNPMPVHPNPLHFLSKNDDGYVDEALLVLLLQIIFCYAILVGSILFMFSASTILIIVPCVAADSYRLLYDTILFIFYPPPFEIFFLLNCFPRQRGI